MTGQVSGIEKYSKFGSAILAIGAKVSVQLVKGSELGVRGSALMDVGAEVDNPDFAALRSGLLHDGQ